MNKKRLLSSIFLASLFAIPSVLAQNLFEPVSNIMLQLSGLITSPTNGPWISAIIILLFFVSVVYIGLGKRLEGKTGGKILIWALGLLLALGLIRLEPDLLEIAGPVAGALLIIFGAFLIYRMFVGIGFPGYNDKIGAASIAFFVVWLAGQFFFIELVSESPWDIIWGLISIIALISFFVIVFRIISFGRRAFTPSQKTMQDIHERLTSSPQMSDLARAASAKAGKDLRNLGGGFGDFWKGVRGTNLSDERNAFINEVKETSKQIKELEGIIPLIDSSVLRVGISQEDIKRAEGVVKKKVTSIVESENKIEDYNLIIQRVIENIFNLQPQRLLAYLEQYAGDARESFRGIPGAVEELERIVRVYSEDLNVLINEIREGSEFYQEMEGVTNLTNLFRARLNEIRNAIWTPPADWNNIRELCGTSIQIKRQLAASLEEARRHRDRLEILRTTIANNIDPKDRIPRELVRLYNRVKKSAPS